MIGSKIYKSPLQKLWQEKEIRPVQPVSGFGGLRWSYNGSVRAIVEIRKKLSNHPEEDLQMLIDFEE
jgi:hypothetical protein